MSYANQIEGSSWRERVRARLAERTTGFVAAVILEILLLMLLFTLGQADEPKGEIGPVVTTFDAASDAQEAAPEAEPEPQPRASEEAPSEQQPVPDQVQPQPAPVEAVPLRQIESFDLSQLEQPRAEAALAAPPPVYGPPDTGVPGDSERVGTAPNGEPLYAAQWYREPSDRMLANYLSTARGPGSALIACRTVPDWRVEDCVALGESPRGSNIARAVLAAAWEFQVRPPRLGGQYKYGEWVRIRITYDLRRR